MAGRHDDDRSERDFGGREGRRTVRRDRRRVADAANGPRIEAVRDGGAHRSRDSGGPARWTSGAAVFSCYLPDPRHGGAPRCAARRILRTGSRLPPRPVPRGRSTWRGGGAGRRRRRAYGAQIDPQGRVDARCGVDCGCGWRVWTPNQHGRRLAARGRSRARREGQPASGTHADVVQLRRVRDLAFLAVTSCLERRRPSTARPCGACTPLFMRAVPGRTRRSRD